MMVMVHPISKEDAHRILDDRVARAEVWRDGALLVSLPKGEDGHFYFDPPMEIRDTDVIRLVGPDGAFLSETEAIHVFSGWRDDWTVEAVSFWFRIL